MFSVTGFIRRSGLDVWPVFDGLRNIFTVEQFPFSVAATLYVTQSELRSH
ncbi:5798_t:CDS:2 [Rhizophagus irregularis]|nr:5798_t:CDS:2 [Rhizophagus irregularis]